MKVITSFTPVYFPGNYVSINPPSGCFISCKPPQKMRSAFSAGVCVFTLSSLCVMMKAVRFPNRKGCCYMPHTSGEKAIYKQIALDIASKVVSGKYRPGEKIHGRSPLASQYNVSPETVRRAVFLLNQVGVLEVRQGAGITIKSVEAAEDFVSKSEDKESLDTIKGHINRLMQEQKQLNNRLQENINILLDANDRFNYLNPLTPFELLIDKDCPLVGKTIASVRFWNNTGATIIAIKRKSKTILSPGPQAQLFAGDYILIVGDEASYKKTKMLLNGSLSL